jgi:hypothetical protein
MSNNKSLRIYLLAVCFVAMVCAAITSGMVLYGLFKMAAPEITLDTYTHNAHQTPENFRRSHFNPANAGPAPVFYPGGASTRALAIDRPGLVKNPGADPDTKPIGDEQLDKLRMESYQQVLSNHQRRAMQELIRLALVLLVSGVLFFTHWRLARKGGQAPLQAGLG